jgi:integrase
MLHPTGQPSAIKVSLRTRDKRQALHLARALGYLAEGLIAKGARSGMTYEEIRAEVKQHFHGLLRERKAAIAEHGRLDGLDVAVLESSLGAARQAVERGIPMSLTENDDNEDMGRFIAARNLSVEQGTSDYRRLETEFRRGYRDYCQAVLEYDQALETFSFDVDDRRQPETDHAVAKAGPSATLAHVAELYQEESVRGDRWVEKTRFEKGKHLALLYEILGRDTDIRTVNAPSAREVKSILAEYPRNRNKNPQTRGLPLVEAVAVPDVDKLNVITINKYLATYAGLFNWAKSNSYVDDAVFSGLAIRKTTKRGVVGRSSFSDAQVRTMLNVLLDNANGLIRKDYQKWGPLIALFTGARLNEIAQIHLADIRQEDGIWYFDLNDNADDKRLKSEASRRLVPIHSQLITFGFLKHVDTMRESGEVKLFPSFSYCRKNGWGRSLGRWFNDTFLKKMGMQDRALVFHSFRHTVVTRLMQGDVPEPIVKEIVGHTQEGVTQQHYFQQGYTLRQLSDALEKLDWPEPTVGE